ncbi:MAG: FAD-binding protein [Candidatus Hodarchaeota archaeon]
MGIIIDKDACTGCENCVSACNFGGVVMVDEVAQITENCNLCGACVKECPVGCIKIEKEDVETVKIDKSQYRGVWVIGEHVKGVIRGITYQLLGKGRELADALDVSLIAVVLGNEFQEELEELGYNGADEIILVKSPVLQEYNSELYVNITTELIGKHKPEIVLIGATPIGRDFAPRVSKRLDAGLTADCTGLEIEEGSRNLLQTRPTFGGNIMAIIKTPDSRPQMATVRANTFKPMSKRAIDVKLTKVDYDIDQGVLATKKVKTIKKERSHVNIEEASVIVSGGRGVGCEENFKLIEELANALNGEVGGSRMACDLNWIDPSCQVGQTGKTVAPQLYMACGISGAIQHKVGMQNSDFVIAINKNPDAPIFDACNVGVVGNLEKIIPALIKEIKSLKSEG